MEINWLWTADHDVEEPTAHPDHGIRRPRTVCGKWHLTIWLCGTAVEHHMLYQYRFARTREVFMGQIQTEAPY